MSLLNSLFALFHFPSSHQVVEDHPNSSSSSSCKSSVTVVSGQMLNQSSFAADYDGTLGTRLPPLIIPVKSNHAQTERPLVLSTAMLDSLTLSSLPLAG